MNLNFKAASAAAISLFAIGALSTCAPATAVWAKDAPTRVGTSQQKIDLLPNDVIAQAAVEADTPSAPELADEIEANITNHAPRMADTKAEPAKSERAGRSLSELVQRHAGTSTANREAECLAGAVYFESKGEPLDGQLAVAQVILNRAKSGRFPGSACGVVFQRSQFSFVRGGGFPPIARTGQQWKTAVAIAHIAKNDLWNSSISNALFFHARRVSPGWRLKRIASVGNHVFYR
jgi:N-acetylmuramoyl-L-alanine amidase